MAVKSIAKSPAQPSSQELTAGYPCLTLHHWLSMAEASVSRMKTYVESCQGPTPLTEEMRRLYLGILGDCERRLQVSLSPEMWQELAREEAQLDAAIHAQRTRKVGVRRKAALAQ